ncbi:MAG: DUF937 domain-containing protein [Pseudomonadota bacterium]
MSLLNLLRSAQGGQGLAQLAKQFDIEEGQAEGLAEMLAPTIGRAARRRADQGSAESVLGQFKGEGMGGYFDRPDDAARPEAQEQGAQFLEQILGSRDATREVAQAAAERAGAEQSKVEQFLPALAAMLQGGIQKQTPDSDIAGLLGQLGGGSAGGGGLMGMVGGLLGGGGTSPGQPQGGSLLGGLANMLDADGDGSPLDDILERVMK